MNAAQDATHDLTDDELDQLVKTEFPYPIAVNYRRLLEIEEWEKKTRYCLEVFEFGLRAIALGLLSQYCIRDLDQVSDPTLDRLLWYKLAKPSTGQWVELLFLGLRAYGGRRDLIFMSELYDLYWDTLREPHQYRKGARGPFQRLVEIRNAVVHYRVLPRDESEWKALGEEAMGYFRDILRRFGFLQHYDMIRILGRQGNEYIYERFTGQAISRHHGPLEGETSVLREDWFYLRRQDGSVLALHPLLLFWFEEMRSAEDEQKDAAVFTCLLKKTVEYVATVAREEVTKSDPDLVSLFWDMLESIRERISEPHRRAEFSWEGLREAAMALTMDLMGATRQKYRRDLYMQREEVFLEFEQFLASDQVCFVLTGKSGVGKSNFVLSLIDECAGRQDISFLMYNGARLEIATTAQRKIGEDLSRFLSLDGGTPEDLFAKLDQQAEMDGKTLVIVFDAINENPDGRTLLRRIDQMVGKARYPWLKIIITSRPHTWRTLKRGLSLAEDLYYRKGGSEDYWVELEDFVIQMEPFPRKELSVVYEKYRKAFGLKTEYKDLKSAIREVLRDPLILRLVAEIHHDETIPERIQLSDIYDQYVQTLLKSDRLYEEDIVLLEQELVPMMIAEGHYANRITAEQVHRANTRDGRPLWELIRSDDPLSPGRKINDSYLRLVDTEILTEQGTPTDYEISFKFERFYDYYGGRRLQSLLEEKTDLEERAAAYQGFIARIQDPDEKRGCPYLWGPVRNALIFDLEHGYDDLVVQLAQTIDQLTKDLIVSALTKHGQDDPDDVRTLCHRLLELGQRDQKSPLSMLPSLLPKRRAPRRVSAVDLAESFLEEASEVHMAKKAAIEVAYNLQFGDVLEQAAYDDSSAARAVAVQYIYYLWRDDREQGFEVLEKISDRITERRIVPNTRALESCLGVSLMIIFWNYKDLDNRAVFLSRLQRIWKKPIEHIFFLREDESKTTGSLKGWIRERVLRLVIGLAMAVARRAEEGGVMFGMDDLGAFFPASESRKQLFAKFVPHIDAVHGGTDSILALRGDLTGLMQDRDMLTTYLTFAVLVPHVLCQPEPTLAVVKEMFKIGMENPPPPAMENLSPAVPLVTILVWVPRNLLYGRRFTGEVQGQRQVATDVLNVLGDFVRRFEERYDSWCSTQLSESRYIELGSYTYFHYYAYGDARSELLSYLLDKAVANNDLDALIRHIASLSGIGSHPAWGVPKAALQGLQAVLERIERLDNIKAIDPDGQLDKVLVASFANLRAYHPDDVDDFLARLEDDEKTREFKRKIQSRGATESLGMLLGTAAAWFARDVVIDPHPLMRNVLKWLLLQAAFCGTFNEWAGLLVKQVVNVAYGQPVFDLPGWPTRAE
jgi:hypothetical protein